MGPKAGRPSEQLPARAWRAKAREADTILQLMQIQKKSQSFVLVWLIFKKQKRLKGKCKKSKNLSVL